MSTPERRALRPLEPRRAVIVGLTLLSGLYAFWIYSLGEIGPLQVWGRGDANLMAADAWLQVPLHLVAAAFVVAGGRSGWHRYAWHAYVPTFVILALLALDLTVSAVAGFRDGVGTAGVIEAATLATLYVVIAVHAVGQARAEGLSGFALRP